jgi:hypothetical protein
MDDKVKGGRQRAVIQYYHQEYDDTSEHGSGVIDLLDAHINLTELIRVLSTMTTPKVSVSLVKVKA